MIRNDDDLYAAILSGMEIKLPTHPSTSDGARIAALPARRATVIRRRPIPHNITESSIDHVDGSTTAEYTSQLFQPCLARRPTRVSTIRRNLTFYNTDGSSTTNIVGPKAEDINPNLYLRRPTIRHRPTADVIEDMSKQKKPNRSAGILSRRLATFSSLCNRSRSPSPLRILSDNEGEEETAAFMGGTSVSALTVVGVTKVTSVNGASTQSIIDEEENSNEDEWLDAEENLAVRSSTIRKRGTCLRRRVTLITPSSRDEEFLSSSNSLAVPEMNWAEEEEDEEPIFLSNNYMRRTSTMRKFVTMKKISHQASGSSSPPHKHDANILNSSRTIRGLDLISRLSTVRREAKISEFVEYSDGEEQFLDTEEGGGDWEDEEQPFEYDHHDPVELERAVASALRLPSVMRRKQLRQKLRDAGKVVAKTATISRGFYETLASRAGEVFSHAGNAAQVISTPIGLIAGPAVAGLVSVGGAAAAAVGTATVQKFGRKRTKNRVSQTQQKLSQFTTSNLVEVATKRMAGHDLANTAHVKVLSQGLGAVLEGGVMAGTVSLVTSSIVANVTDPEAKQRLLANSYIQTAADAMGHFSNVAHILPGKLRNLAEVAGTVGSAASSASNAVDLGLGGADLDLDSDDDDDDGDDVLNNFT